MKRAIFAVCVLAAMALGYVSGQVDSLPVASAQYQGLTEPEARLARFVNEQVRPLAEECRAMKLRQQALDAEWALLSASIPNDSTVIVDGRAAEGIAPLTGQQINDIVYAVNVQVGAINLATMAPACVRAVEVR
jgi:hypothetical protein